MIDVAAEGDATDRAGQTDIGFEGGLIGAGRSFRIVVEGSTDIEGPAVREGEGVAAVEIDLIVELAVERLAEPDAGIGAARGQFEGGLDGVVGQLGAAEHVRADVREVRGDRVGGGRPGPERGAAGASSARSAAPATSAARSTAVFFMIGRFWFGLLGRSLPSGARLEDRDRPMSQIAFDGPVHEDYYVCQHGAGAARGDFCPTKTPSPVKVTGLWCVRCVCVLCLQGGVAVLVGADADDILHREHEDLAVADLAGLGAP